MNDEKLIESIKVDDSKAFEQLFNDYFPLLVNYAIRYVKDTEAAKEIVQESFIAFWNKRKELKITSSLSGYLYRSVQNRSINFLKSKDHHRLRSLTLEREDDPSDIRPDGKLYEDDLADIIDTAIRSLPEKTHLFFSLSRDEELSYKEISKQFSVSVKTVEYHVSNALKRIREALEKYWYLPIIVIFI